MRAYKYFYPSFFLLLSLSFFLTSCGSQSTIVNRVDEREANEIIVFLSSKGIQASKVPSSSGNAAGGQTENLWDITVPPDQATQAMAYLNEAGLPRRRSQNLLNIFKNVGLVPSEMQEKIRYQAGLAEQIASTIRKIDGILDAEVQISFPEENPLKPGEKKGQITASVYIKDNGVLNDPNLHLRTKIKRLVAASVTGLKYNNVTIIATRGRYAELPTNIGATQKNKLVSVWSVTIAEDSLFTFRLIFFSMIILILLLLIAMAWLGWKIFPVLNKYGGIKSLLHMQPILDQKSEGEEEEEEESSQEEEEEEEDEDEEQPPPGVT